MDKAVVALACNEGRGDPLALALKRKESVEAFVVKVRGRGGSGGGVPSREGAAGAASSCGTGSSGARGSKSFALVVASGCPSSSARLELGRSVSGSAGCGSGSAGSVGSGMGGQALETSSCRQSVSRAWARLQDARCGSDCRTEVGARVSAGGMARFRSAGGPRPDPARFPPQLGGSPGIVLASSCALPRLTTPALEPDNSCIQHRSPPTPAPAPRTQPPSTAPFGLAALRPVAVAVAKATLISAPHARRRLRLVSGAARQRNPRLRPQLSQTPSHPARDRETPRPSLPQRAPVSSSPIAQLRPSIQRHMRPG